MQNPIQKFRQSSIVFEKPGILSENLKTLTSSNYPTVQYFLLKLRAQFLHANVYKRVCGIFLIFFQILSYLQKLKRPGFHTLIFYTFINNLRSKQNKKIPHTILQILLQARRNRGAGGAAAPQNFAKFCFYELEKMVLK